MELQGCEGKRLFVLVGWSVYGNEVVFTYPKLYKKEVHTSMAAIGQYLEQQYGIRVRQFFTPEERERMKHTKWDDNGHTDTHRKWTDMTRLEQLNTLCNQTAKQCLCNTVQHMTAVSTKVPFEGWSCLVCNQKIQHTL
eukprot:430683-Ditylum_brightwellii.AAC.1